MKFFQQRKVSYNPSTIVFLAFAMLLVLQGCADYYAYNMTSHPQKIILIPQNKLEAEVNKAYRKKDVVAISQRLADKSWGAEFVSTAGNLYGWRPDFCRLLQARNNPSIDLDSFMLETESNIKMLKSIFWESYLRNVYFDVMEGTPTAHILDNEAFRNALAVIVKVQPTVKVRGEIESVPVSDSSVKEEPEDRQFNASLTALRKSEAAPICSGNEEPGWKELSPVLSRSFLTRFLRIIDNDHSKLLLEDGPLEQAKPVTDKWIRRSNSTDDRSVTVSRVSAASISPSIERSISAETKEKPAFLDLTDKGQKAVVDYVGSIAENCVLLATLKDDKKKTCEKRAFESLKSLLAELSPKNEKPALENFETKQSFSLALSSILNSPDVMNRLDYVSTYLLLFTYPFPANGGVSLEEEFWVRFKSLQSPRRPEDRPRYYETDIESAWRALRVTIENVETTVQYAPLQEIAHITREAGQGIEIKPEPSIELKGTIKGKIETPMTISSSLKTAVEEKLIKELDRRSTWLNPERNILRLTQRGMESINISGGLRERVTLKVPASRAGLSYLDFIEQEVKVKSVEQPMYRKVTALSVSVGVVREPYEFHRSASEKYGLPDSADAYNIVVVSSPVELPVWEWGRTVDRLEMKDLEFSLRPGMVDPAESPLWFFSPALKLEAPARLGTKSGEELRIALRGGLKTLLEGSKEESVTEETKKKDAEKEEKKLGVRCVKVKFRFQEMDKDGLYLVLGHFDKLGQTNTDKLNDIWIGKQGVTTETRTDITDPAHPYRISRIHIAPFEGTETKMFHELLTQKLCSS